MFYKQILFKGGKCVEKWDGNYECICPVDFKGKNCEENANECTLVSKYLYFIKLPLHHANINLINLDARKKLVHLVNAICRILRSNNLQSNPCLNGGRCIDEGNNYKCQCRDGYSGTLCQDKIKTCVNKPCLNGGRCINHIEGDYQCRCPLGFFGKNCDIKKSACTPNLCK